MNRVTLSCEAELLLACINISSTPEEKNARIERFLKQQVDWNRFTNLVMMHGMASMVCAELKSKLGPGGIPSATFAGLRYWDIANVESTAQIATELITVMTRFEAAGISALAVKGPALSQLMYGNLSSRNYSDLDMLVLPSDVAAAAEVLISAGFQPRTYNREAFRTGFFCSTSDDFASKTASAAVDLHWRIREHYFPFGPDEDQLWSRPETVFVRGHAVRTLSAGDHLLFLCAHASKHGWPNLTPVMDVAALLRARPELDVPALIEEAVRMGFKRMVLLGLDLAHRLAGATLAHDVFSFIAQDSAVRALTEQISTRFVARLQPLGSLEKWIAAASTLESRTQQVRMMMVHGLIPVADDYARLPLPRALYPLYYAIRPLHLTERAVAMTFRRPARPRSVETSIHQQKREKRGSTPA